ncbi:unnamed protein product [Brassicogethes aeneus]|uniref:NADH:ubiquinone oxidoreductase intermediate-associated protein 30 domain-containing protein n=1 Tax=Brassicogethes aeneus TaxID=1431903 RepID=A0A9P0FJR7_BRAAE|nr:unnamed protein product [Brassicogethes aeneus]
MFNFFALFFLIGVFSGLGCCDYIDNFEKQTEILWKEQSDTLMGEGKSKATLTLLQNGPLQRAVLFTLLDPQPDGAAFAGIRKNVKLDLTNVNKISMNIKSRGEYRGYEFCLRDRGLSGVRAPAYCQYFKGPEDFETVNFAIDEFKPHFEGQILTNYTALDKANVSQLSLLTYGGVRLPKHMQQSGVAAMEINWISIS